MPRSLTPLPDIQEHRGRLDGLVVGEEHDTTGLEEDEETVGAVSGVGQIDHAVKGEVGKGGLHLQWDQGTCRLFYGRCRCGGWRGVVAVTGTEGDGNDEQEGCRGGCQDERDARTS